MRSKLFYRILGTAARGTHSIQRETDMGALKNLAMEMIDQCLSGNEDARDFLLEFDVPEALYGLSATLDAVTGYVQLGMSIVPQMPGAKQPCVRWRPYQLERPTVAQLYQWYRKWPDAGIAVVLGAVSNLFAIDVDGREAHDALIEHLGKVPKAPMSISGSGKPYRYHLFFRHPGFATKAKATPWHPQLEFRGDRGIVVLPPSKHKSGNLYRWKNCPALYDLESPEFLSEPPKLPKKIIEALQAPRNSLQE